MDASYPPTFSPGDLVTIAETGSLAVVILNTWRGNAWHVVCDRPHTNGSVIRQTVLESAIDEWMPK